MFNRRNSHSEFRGNPDLSRRRAGWTHTLPGEISGEGEGATLHHLQRRNPEAPYARWIPSINRKGETRSRWCEDPDPGARDCGDRGNP